MALPARKKSFFLIPVFILSLVALVFAEGTLTWEQSNFDELSKGTASGVAIRSQGGLELAPAFKTLTTTPSTYIWGIASDRAGNVYAAAGAPARVYRVTPDGKSTTIFGPQELQVQALAVDAQGDVYAATNPDGKIYRIHPSAVEDKPSGKNGSSAKSSADPGWSASLFFDPHTKYIWDVLLDRAGNLYVATGDHGEIFRVSPDGHSSLFFRSDDAHIRVLALDHQGNLIAGSDGSGLVYRIAPDGKAFVLYSAPKKEITALAVDSAGDIYAAGAGEKNTNPNALVPSLPIQMAAPKNAAAPAAQGGITLSAPAPTPSIVIGNVPESGAIPGGSEIYKIAPDGSPSTVWSSPRDLVYALAFDHDGHLLAGTGNHGHIFAISGEDKFADLLQASASQVTAFADAPDGAIYACTSNLGKIFVLGAGPATEGTYESDIFDAHIFSRWGRLEFRRTGNIDLFVRSGNVDNPDRNWSPWQEISPQAQNAITAPAARFIQWKAVLHAGAPAPRLDSVTVNYLPKNVAPDFDGIAVQVGVRFQSLPQMQASGRGRAGNQSNFDAQAPTLRDPDSIAVKWAVHDDNDDQMVYSIYYKGDGESRWLLLKDGLTGKFYSFDASLLPDGGYTIKVVASDAPSHSPGHALTAEVESSRFEVDTTPPRIEGLTASIEGGEIHIAFQAKDSFSNIKRAEFSVDAGDWQYIAPVGQISDAKSERYDFKVPAPKEGSGGNPEHVVVVRAYDKYDNLGAAKTIIR